MSAWWLTAEEWAVLWLSLRVAIVSVMIMIAPGILIAWVLARKEFWGKSLVDAIVHLPLVLPPVVTGFLLLLVLGRRGFIGQYLHAWFGIDVAFTWKAAVIAAAVMGFPLFIRAVRLSIELVDQRLEQAAGTLGANTWRVFLSITLPLSMPGILTGCVLALARSLGEFGATITFAGNIPNQTRTLPVAVFTYTQVPGGDAAAMRLVMISILLSLAALMCSNMIARRAHRQLAGLL